MKTLVVKLGLVPRRAHDLVGIYCVDSFETLVRCIGNRVDPNDCLAKELSHLGYALDLVGRARPGKQTHVQSAFFDRDFASKHLAAGPDWNPLNDFKKEWEHD